MIARNRVRTRRRILRPILGILLLGAGAGRLAAGTTDTGSSSGGSPTTSEGSTVRVKFNPTITVTVQPGESIGALLQRLAQDINATSGDEYTATVPVGSNSLQILRSDGSEIDDLSVRENDPGIQSTMVTVNRPRLAARIHFIEEDPSLAGGAIVVTLNDRVATVNTAWNRTASKVTEALVQAIRNAGFLVEVQPPEIVVLWDTVNSSTLTRVGLRSTDPAIVTSDVGLDPLPAEGSAAGVAGVTALALLLCGAGAWSSRRG